MESMKIVIGADLGQAIQQVNTLAASVTALGGTANAAGGVSTALAKIPLALRPIKADELTKLSVAFRQLQVDAVKLKFDALNQVPAGLKAIPAAASQAATALSGIKPGANQAGASLNDLSRVLQDAPYGFIGISNNINPLLESFQRLRASSGSTGGALRALGSSLLGGGGLGLAISAITAAVTFASIGFDRWLPKVKESGKATKELQDSSEGIVKALGEEASRIAVLVSAIQADTLSKKQRNGAIQELQRLNSDYFGQLDKEKALVAQVNTAYTAYTASLLKQYSAKALGKQLDELFDKRLKLQIQLDDSAATVNNPGLERSRNNIQAKINALGGISILPKDLTDVTKLTPVQQQVIQLQQDLAKISSIRIFDLTGISTELKDVNNQINGLLTRVSKAGNLDIKLPGGPDKKEADALKQSIANLEAYGQAVGFTSTQFQKLIDLRVKLVTRDQLKLGLDKDQLAAEIAGIRASNELYEQRAARLADVAKATALIQGDKLESLNIEVGMTLNKLTAKKIDANEAQRIIDTEFKDAGIQIPTTIAIEPGIQEKIKAFGLSLPIVPLTIAPKFEELQATALKDSLKGIQTTLATKDFSLKPNINLKPSLNKAFLDAQRDARNAGEQLAGALEGAIESGLGSLGETLGAAIAGGDIQSLFGGFIGVLADGLKTIGKAIIAYGVSMDAIKKAFTNPYVAIAAGIGLVAAGTVLATTMREKKFAEGGIVTGPTRGLVGEAGPEVIFPLNQINRFMKQHTTGNVNSGGAFTVSHTIRGADLRLLIYRDERSAGSSSRF